MRSQFESRQQTFEMVLPTKPVIVAADLGYIRMVIENILSNACVYTPNGGKITVKLTKGSKKCDISVTDTGVGIRKADLSKLFSKFSRIHNPLSVQAGGSGIGLYLAAEIIRLHKGTITVESRIHKGTTFAISLPLAQNKA
jgi:signal transduction histidine kinase